MEKTLRIEHTDPYGCSKTHILLRESIGPGILSMSGPDFFSVNEIGKKVETILHKEKVPRKDRTWWQFLTLAEPGYETRVRTETKKVPEYETIYKYSVFVPIVGWRYPEEYEFLDEAEASEFLNKIENFVKGSDD